MSESSALITGVAGQDGVLLARHLTGLGYRVVGTRRPGSPVALAPYLEGITVVEHELVDTASFVDLVRAHQPHEVYNLAGVSSVARSWERPDETVEVNAAAVERILEALFEASGDARFFQASSSEVFGTSAPHPQSEDTPHDPANPYAEAKARAQAAVSAARGEGHFASAGILFNHESPLRGAQFVTRKITRAVAEIAAGEREYVELGNLDVARDWGSAREYVVAMHAALAHDEPSDYVIATGQTHTLGELVEAAFAAAGVDDPWGRVRQDPSLMRQGDAPVYVGDPTRAREVLGWQARISFDELVADMVRVDRERVASGVEESPAYL